MFALFLSCLGLFFYVIVGLDPAIQRSPEDDRRKNNIVIAGLAFLYVMFGLGPDIHRFPGQAGE